MNIKFVPRKDVDIQRYDSCIQTSKTPHVYAFSWYLDIVCAEWGIFTNEDYTIVFPVAYKVRFGIKNAYQPYLTQQLGIFSANDLNQSITNQFIECLKAEFHYAVIALNVVKHGFPNQRINQKLSLNKSYDELFSNCSKSHRKNVRKAQKHEISIATDAMSIATFIEGYTNRLKAKQIDINPSDKVRQLKLFQTLQENHLLHVLSALKGDVTIGAMLFFKVNNTIYIQSWLTPDGRQLSAQYLLIDTIIQQFADTETVIDFMGSSLQGVQQWNAGCGAVAESYPILSFYRAPFNLLHKIGLI